MLNHLSLFSGYEGFGLGLRLAGLPIRTVGYLEIDDYCQRVLQVRMADGVLDHAPIIRDITACDFRPMAGLVDIITAGFPCQPHSVAGLRAGAHDGRNLWPYTLRAISDVGPRFVVLENVPGILANGYGGTVVGQLAEIGYDCRWAIVSAAEVGAPHRRARWWCLAHRARVCPYADGEQPTQPGECQTSQESGGFGAGWGAGVADAGSPRCQGCRHGAVPMGTPHAGAVYPGTASMADANGPRRETKQGYDNGRDETRQPPLMGSGSERRREELADAASLPDWWGGQPRADAGRVPWWAAEPALGRVVDGCPHRVDQVRTLGNGIVPAVVAEFLRMIAT